MLAGWLLAASQALTTTITSSYYQCNGDMKLRNESRRRSVGFTPTQIGPRCTGAGTLCFLSSVMLASCDLMVTYLDKESQPHFHVPVARPTTFWKVEMMKRCQNR